MELTTRQSGLDQIGRVHGAIGFTGADQSVHLIDEEHDAAFGLLNFFQNGFESLLELTAKLRASNQRAHIEGEQALILQAFRDIAIDDP